MTEQLLDGARQQVALRPQPGCFLRWSRRVRTASVMKKAGGAIPVLISRKTSAIISWRVRRCPSDAAALERSRSETRSSLGAGPRRSSSSPMYSARWSMPGRNRSGSPDS
ncbi:hypothetical protein [Streptomyces sp. NBC_01386]|uniref:hypothetical protein n=1 Tax=Streptomyces sp. NBC_01386 TaxID=2903848 RepID=UPI003865065B